MSSNDQRIFATEEPSRPIYIQQGLPSPVPAPPAGAMAGAMRRKTRWVDIPDQDSYPGWKIHLWVNFPASYMTEMARLARSNEEGSQEAVTELMGKILLEHNNWPLPDGSGTMPSPQSADFYDVIPQELQAALGALIRSEVSKLPNSVSSPMPSTNGTGPRRAVL